jgi:hypothetical protein
LRRKFFEKRETVSEQEARVYRHTQAIANEPVTKSFGKLTSKERRCGMNISSYGLKQNKQCMDTWKATGKTRRHEALPGFYALTLKEKCLYLIKISKRNTSRQTLVLTGAALLVLAVDYLLL